jgi:hypothetical protein
MTDMIMMTVKDKIYKMNFILILKLSLDRLTRDIITPLRVGNLYWLMMAVATWLRRPCLPPADHASRPRLSSSRGHHQDRAT